MSKTEIEIPIPKINLKELQQRANEAAKKGALSVIDDYYSGYNSPYKKALEKELATKSIGYGFTLPDVLAEINDQLAKEIDQIANAAIAKSFIPLVKRFLTREPGEVKFSDILQVFVKATDFDVQEDDWEDYNVEVVEELTPNNSFMYVEISCPKITYKLGFTRRSHQEEVEGVKTKVEVLNCFTLPTIKKTAAAYSRWNTDYSSITQTMKISLDGASLELPFTKNILADEFNSFIAKLIMGENSIVIDKIGFNEDMFPEDVCHCH